MPLSATLRRKIHLAHAMQLAQLQLPSRSEAPKEEPSSGESDLQFVKRLIEENPVAFKAAQDSQCTSTAPDFPNWDTVLFTLAESVAMILRKDDEVVKAAEAPRSGDLVQAAEHLRKSQEDIDTVATLLDCTFVQLCDFVARGPDELWHLEAGAFCGLFISNSTEKPFMGITYKGTTVGPEYLTDILWRPITPLRPDVAWGAPMHFGFYEGLFGTYTTEGSDPQVPFDLMLQNLSEVYAAHANASCTSRSMGGAYCMITYGEFLRRQAEPAFAKFKFGDMYALSAPRVCLEPFATEVKQRTQDPEGGKFSFRIVNKDDPVPTVPPVFDSQLAEYTFVHPGNAWRITPDGPEKMNDEPPQATPAGYNVIYAGGHHDPREFYANWQKTPHS